MRYYGNKDALFRQIIDGRYKDVANIFKTFFPDSFMADFRDHEPVVMYDYSNPAQRMI